MKKPQYFYLKCSRSLYILHNIYIGPRNSKINISNCTDKAPRRRDCNVTLLFSDKTISSILKMDISLNTDAPIYTDSWCHGSQRLSYGDVTMRISPRVMIHGQPRRVYYIDAPMLTILQPSATRRDHCSHPVFSIGSRGSLHTHAGFWHSRTMSVYPRESSRNNEISTARSCRMDFKCAHCLIVLLPTISAR